jgi:hypothetical protein
VGTAMKYPVYIFNTPELESLMDVQKGSPSPRTKRFLNTGSSLSDSISGKLMIAKKTNGRDDDDFNEEG